MKEADDLQSNGAQDEREFKFDVDARFHLPIPASVGIRMEERGVKEMSATYWDTAGFDLARRKSLVRYRDDKAWTMKLPKPSNVDGAKVRGEEEFDGVPEELPTDLKRRLRTFIGGKPVAPVLVMEQRRQKRDVFIGEVKLGELVHDAVKVRERAGADVAGTFYEVEFEVPDLTHPAVESVLTLVRAHGGRPSSASKYERALAILGQDLQGLQ